MAIPVKPVIPGYEPDNVVAFDAEFASPTPGVMPLPCLAVNHPAGTILTRWVLTPQEIERVVELGGFWLQMATFGRPLNPLAFRFEAPTIEAAEPGGVSTPFKPLWDHELKSWPEYFRQIWAGNLPFQVRRDDRGVESGQHLLLREWDPALRDSRKGYTGRALIVPTLSVLRDVAGLGLPVSHCVIGLNLAGMRRFETWPLPTAEAGEAVD